MQRVPALRVRLVMTVAPEEAGPVIPTELAGRGIAPLSVVLLLRDARRLDAQGWHRRGRCLLVEHRRLQRERGHGHGIWVCRGDTAREHHDRDDVPHASYSTTESGRGDPDYDGPVLNGGSRIVLTARGPLRLHSATLDRPSPLLELAGRQLPVEVDGAVFDLHVADTVILAVVDETIVLTSLDLDDIRYLTGPFLAGRVVSTASQVYIGTSREVTTHRGDPIHPTPLDLAATADELAVLDRESLTIYDAGGRRLRDLALFAPTALAPDRIEGGWLAAVDGGIVRIDGTSVRMLAPVEDRVFKVRRGTDGVYVLVKNQLRRIAGDRLAQVTVFPYDTGDWNDFDAGPEGFVRFLE